MNFASTEVIQLFIGAIVGAGVYVTMESHGFSIFRSNSRRESLYILAIFCSVWVIGMSLVVWVFGESPCVSGIK